MSENRLLVFQTVCDLVINGTSIVLILDHKFHSMKKLLFILLTAVVFSCASDKKDDTTDKSENQPGIPNVNGNIPDTTNSINLDNDKRDTSKSSPDSGD